MIRVLISDGMEYQAIENLKKLGVEVVNKHYQLDELKIEINKFDALIIRSATKVRKDLLSSLSKDSKLKLIIRGGVGVDNIDVDYAESNGIKVFNTPNSSSASAAEMVLAHMFCLARFLNNSNITMREGKWNKKKYIGIELNGKTLGIVGMGRIGKELASKAYALGMKIVYFDQLGEQKDIKDYEYNSFDELLNKSDFISLNASGTKAIITKTEINKMKEGVFIINCARGKMINEADLLEGLNNGKVAGAGLDVFFEEPTKNKELVNHPKVSVTPHIGASTKEAQIRIGEEIVTIIKNFFNL